MMDDDRMNVYKIKDAVHILDHVNVHHYANTYFNIK